MRDLILEHIDIDSVIGAQGKKKITCPFPDHDDTDPSFAIYPDSFYCFGCKRGGSVIDFVMYRDNVTAGEAMKSLSTTFNLPMHNWTPAQMAKWEEQKREKDIVLGILGEAARYYHNNMTIDQREYYYNRGLSDDIIDSLQLGYADGTLYEAFKNGDAGTHNDAGLLKSGLFKKFDGGEIKDSFVNRYILPYWKAGKVVYMIGRLDVKGDDVEQYPAWNRAKYKKLSTYDEKSRPYISKEIKNDCFYGEDSVNDNKVGIITEGVLDCIHLLQLEYSCISPVTEEFRDADMPKLAKLAKHWKTVYIANDNEKSGIGHVGALKTARHLFKEGIDVRVITLPRDEAVEKVDVADFFTVPPAVYELRVRDFQLLLDEAPEFMQYQIEIASDLPDADKREVAKEIFELLISCDDKMEIDHVSALMRKNKLVSSVKMFNDGLKEARNHYEKERKAQMMTVLEQTDKLMFVKVQVEEIRKDKSRCSFEIKEDISKFVIDDLKIKGRFHFTVSDEFFWFENETQELHGINDALFNANILRWYGVNASEPEAEYLHNAIVAECFNGTETEIQNFAFYDNKRCVLYVHNQGGGIYRINGDKVELVHNGTDGVLFLKSPYWDTFEYKNWGNECLHEKVINPINFDDGEYVYLNKDEQRVLFLYWIYSLFFESIQSTKPIMAMIGEKGSGKSTVMKLVGKMLLGAKYNVTPLTKEEDFDASISNNSFVFYDNADSKLDWLNDRLAHTATGKMIQKRKLYTTNESVTFFPKCFIGINARDPRFKREDVIDRLLLFRVSRLEHFQSESVLCDDIITHRDELMSELLNDLNSIVDALKGDNEPFMSQHRMADWADFGWRVAKINGQQKEFVGLIEKMDKEQTEFLLAEHPIFLALEAWLVKPDNQGREMDSGSLLRDLQMVAEEESLYFPYENAQSLGMQLKNILSNLREVFEVHASKKSNRWRYSFSLKK